MESYVELIKERTSWRTFNGKKLVDEDRERVEAFLEEDHVAPFGNRPRFRLVDHVSDDGKIGTYGFIRGAQHYLVGAVRRASMSIEDYGYLFEKIILYATGFGLGTCWLGGTFTRKPVFDRMVLSVDEVIPAISPVGYKEGRGLVDKAIRWTAGSRNRKPWGLLFFRDSFDTPLSPDEAGVYGLGFEMVRIGPSASNGQPWRLVLDGDVVHFYYAGRDYSVFKKLDLGIAMCHFDHAMKEQGVVGEFCKESGHESNYVATWCRS